MAASITLTQEQLTALIGKAVADALATAKPSKAPKATAKPKGPEAPAHDAPLADLKAYAKAIHNAERSYAVQRNAAWWKRFQPIYADGATWNVATVAANASCTRQQAEARIAAKRAASKVRRAAAKA